MSTPKQGFPLDPLTQGLMNVALERVPEEAWAHVEPAARDIVREVSRDYWIGALQPLEAIRLVQHRVERLVGSFA